MDDDQKPVLARQVADFHHGHPVARWADGNGEFVVALVGVVEDGVAKRVPDVLVCYAVLACGCEDSYPHSAKVTCRVVVVKLLCQSMLEACPAQGSVAATADERSGQINIVRRGRAGVY
jgi:hypothetical protein